MSITTINAARPFLIFSNNLIIMIIRFIIRNEFYIITKKKKKSDNFKLSYHILLLMFHLGK